MAEFYMSQKDWNKVINYAKASVEVNKDSEIGGMMVMLKDKDGDYVLKDPVILKQQVTGTTCEMDQNELALYYSKTYRKHKNNKLKSRVRYVWWHSHANMKAFWSGTDDKTIMGSPSDDFTVSLVVNVRSEYKLRVQFFQPIETYEDVELTIMNGKTTGIPKAILEEVEEKAKKYAYTNHYMNRPNKIGKVKDIAQGNIWDNVYGTSYGGYNYSYNGNVRVYSSKKDDVDYNQLLTYIDSLNSRYVSGELKYKQWKEAVKGTNKQLEGKKSDYRFTVLNATDLDNVVYFTDASTFITTINGYGEEQ